MTDDSLAKSMLPAPGFPEWQHLQYLNYIFAHFIYNPVAKFWLKHLLCLKNVLIWIQIYLVLSFIWNLSSEKQTNDVTFMWKHTLILKCDTAEQCPKLWRPVSYASHCWIWVQTKHSFIPMLVTVGLQYKWNTVSFPLNRRHHTRTQIFK